MRGKCGNMNTLERLFASKENRSDYELDRKVKLLRKDLDDAPMGTGLNSAVKRALDKIHADEKRQKLV